MVVGLGIDLVELDRIESVLERHGERFLRHILTDAEREKLPEKPAARVAYVAGRFAAKEAALKALGTGMAEGITLKEAEVERLPNGQPILIFHGKAHTRAELLGVCRAAISLTHSRQTAGAVVVLEAI